MAKFDALVAIVVIIALASYLIVRSVIRTGDRNKRLATVLLELNICRQTIRLFDTELTTQSSAGYFDPQPFHQILSDHKKEVTT